MCTILEVLTNIPRLQGNGVEIVVGVDPNQTIWFVPIALVCYYSLTLRNTHKRDRH